MEWSVAVSSKSVIDSVLRCLFCQFAVHQTAVLCGGRVYTPMYVQVSEASVLYFCLCIRSIWPCTYVYVTCYLYSCLLLSLYYIGVCRLDMFTQSNNAKELWLLVEALDPVSECYLWAEVRLLQVHVRVTSSVFISTLTCMYVYM